MSFESAHTDTPAIDPIDKIILAIKNFLINFILKK